MTTRGTPTGQPPTAAVPVTGPAMTFAAAAPTTTQTPMAGPAATGVTLQGGPLLGLGGANPSSGGSVGTALTGDYSAQMRVTTQTVVDPPDPTVVPGTVAYAGQTHEQDPTSTIALEIKRAQTLFESDAATVQREVTAQSEVIAFWMIREKSTTLDVVHCLSEFTTETIGAPHALKQKIIGFMGDRVDEQNPPGLLAPDNVFAKQRGRAPTLDILAQSWQTAADMTTFLTATQDMEMLAGIPLLCYIPAAWVPYGESNGRPQPPRRLFRQIGGDICSHAE
jgi:hypothetical protein